MEFRKYFYGLPVDEREAFATSCETTVGHLRNVAYGKTCGEKLAIAIERTSKGTVRCEEMRPDVDWAYLRNSPAPAAGTHEHQREAA